jgi:TolB-like protein
MISPAPERWRRPLAFVALALLPLLAALAVGLWRWIGTAGPGSATDLDPADALAVALDRALQRSAKPLPAGLAIKPLDAVGGSADLRALADSICESLSGGLTRLRVLRVASCASTRTALAAELDDHRLTQLLRVDYLLSGRLHAVAGDRIRVQLVLHDREAQPRWRIDEELALGALQNLPERVSTAAAQAIGQPAPVSAEPALDPALYPLMLRASQLARRPSPGERREALALVETVLASAPEHAPARYLRLALLSQLSNVPGGPARKGNADEIRAAQDALRREVRELGQQLVAADPGDWRGNILLINDALMHRRWGEMLDRADIVLEHAGNHPGLLRIAARLNLHVGYIRRAQALALDAARVDALDAEALGVLALTHGMLGRTMAMRELLAIAEQLGHRQLELAQIIDASRRGDRALLEKAATAWVSAGHESEAVPPWAAPWLAALLDPAQRAGGVAALDAATEGARLLRAGFLVEYALLGEHERALRSLQGLVRRPIGPWIQHLWWPELGPLRRDPGFVRAMQELGLTALWEARGAPEVCERGADGQWTCR